MSAGSWRVLVACAVAAVALHCGSNADSRGGDTSGSDAGGGAKDGGASDGGVSECPHVTEGASATACGTQPWSVAGSATGSGGTIAIHDGAAVLISNSSGIPVGLEQEHLPKGDFQLSVAFESLNTATTGQLMFGFTDFSVPKFMVAGVTSSKVEIDVSDSGETTVLEDEALSVCNGRVDFRRTGSELTITVTVGGKTVSASAEGFANADWLMIATNTETSVRLTDISGSGDTAATLIDSFDCDSIARK